MLSLLFYPINKGIRQKLSHPCLLKTGIYRFSSWKIAGVAFLLFFNTVIFAQKPKQPNIILILTDDMGFGDVSCYNGPYSTPNIDGLAREGIRFTNYYSASPICSPSRAGILTGMHPARWNFTTFLHTKAANQKAQQADFLNPQAPSIARILKSGEYTTAHFGKWHMGGGRDVTDAPNLDQYGFDEWASTYESPDPDPLLTATNWIWSNKDSIKRWNRTAYFVDKTLNFLKKNSDKPCYINLWPDDVHTPWVPEDGKAPGSRETEENFVAVLKEYDRQIGRLMRGLKELGIDGHTLVIFTSDNGPLPHFRHNRSTGMRGSKLSLYEGGIRLPFIVRWPDKIGRAQKDSISVISANDLLPSLCRIAGVRPDKRYRSDGEDRSAAFLGTPSARSKPLFWEYGRNDTAFNYPKGRDKSPALALREKNWKFLINPDKTNAELYDLANDQSENNNLAAHKEELVKTFTNKMLAWWNSLPAYRKGSSQKRK